MNDKLMNLVMIIFFAGIISNGLLIMLSLTPNGGWIVGQTLTQDNLNYDNMHNNFNTNTPTGFISNTSQSQDASSFNPIQVISDAFGTVFGGIFAINYILAGIIALENVFFVIGGWFPIFSPVLYSIAGLFLGSKILLVGYAASGLLNGLLGRR